MTGVGDGDADAFAWAGSVIAVEGGVVGADKQAASALAHGVDGVGDEVVEDLANVVLEAEHRSGAVEGCIDGDSGVGQAALVKIEDVSNEIAGADLGGADGLAVEAECLRGDL